MANMTPSELYQRFSQRIDFNFDPVQLEAVAHLQQIHRQVLAGKQIKGLYLWGLVGRGKTLLLDILYQSLGRDIALRVHFYRFMQDLHRRLAKLQGQPEPLERLARQIATDTRVLCFDEFLVNDIGDAMLLSGLIRALFEQGVVIVATSNVEPSRLYERGLQRQRFMPAIQAIQDNMLALHMDGSSDHRLRQLTQAQAYFTHDSLMLAHFKRHCHSPFDCDGEIIIEQRPIKYTYMSVNSLWLDFAHLCQSARSQNDYIALAERFERIYINGLPQLGGELSEWRIAHGTEDGAKGAELARLNHSRQALMQQASKTDDEARRFVTLVDELYDRKVKLYLCSTVAIVDLYQGGRLDFEFERTISRLIEMQSVAYLEEQRLHQDTSHTDQ